MIYERGSLRSVICISVPTIYRVGLSLNRQYVMWHFVARIRQPFQHRHYILHTNKSTTSHRASLSNSYNIHHTSTKMPPVSPPSLAPYSFILQNKPLIPPHSRGLRIPLPRYVKYELFSFPFLCCTAACVRVYYFYGYSTSVFCVGVAELWKRLRDFKYFYIAGGSSPSSA